MHMIHAEKRCMVRGADLFRRQKAEKSRRVKFLYVFSPASITILPSAVRKHAQNFLQVIQNLKKKLCRWQKILRYNYHLKGTFKIFRSKRSIIGKYGKCQILL